MTRAVNAVVVGPIDKRLLAVKEDEFEGDVGVASAVTMKILVHGGCQVKHHSAGDGVFGGERRQRANAEVHPQVIEVGRAFMQDKSNFDRRLALAWDDKKGWSS